MLASQKRNITRFAQKVYLGDVQVKLGNQDKIWAPHKAWKTCVETLKFWTQGKSSVAIWNTNNLGEQKVMADILLG